MKTLMLIAAVAAILTGCNTETTQTVEWYKAHDTERHDMVARCRDNPGDTQLEANCINAKQAEKELLNARRGFIQPPGFTPKKGG